MCELKWETLVQMHKTFIIAELVQSVVVGYIDINDDLAKKVQTVLGMIFSLKPDFKVQCNTST